MTFNLSDYCDFIRQAVSRPVVLTGMMGSGKSHVGRLLAGELACGFYDSDSLIEERAGRSIPDIFAEFGEGKFREAEERAVLDVLNRGELCVLSTGGGAVTSASLRSAIGEKSVSVWLRADIEILWDRVRKNTNRPLLQKPDPKDILKTLLAERADFYAQADIIIDVSPDSVDETVKSVIKALYEHVHPD